MGTEIQGRNRSRKQCRGFSQRRAEQKAIFQPTRMGNIRRSLTRRKCSTRFDWSRGPLDIHHSDQKNTEISQTTTEYIPYYTVLPKNTKKQKERSPELGRLFKRRLRPQRGSCRHGVDLLQPFSSRQLCRIE